MMTAIPEGFADLVGPVAIREFEAAANHYKPGLIEWTHNLSTLEDDEFLAVAGSAIYGSALINSFRGNWEHEHFKATVCYVEAKRRHVAAGHAKDCRAETLYGRAHARVMRESGYQPRPPADCTCNAPEE